MSRVAQSYLSVASVDGTFSRAGSARWLAAVLCAATLFAASADCSAAGYQYTDLNPAGFIYSSASDINNLGQIVGYASGSNQFQSTAILWNGAVATSLPNLPGRLFSDATSINDAGLIVGTSFVGGRYETRGVEWNGTVPTLLKTPPGTELPDVSSPAAINNSGMIVGNLSGPYNRAVLWSDPATSTDVTKATALSGLTVSSVSGINNAGQVVGYAQFGNDSAGGRAVIVSGTTTTLLDGPGVASAINDSGQVVGRTNFAGVDSSTFPLLWSNGTATPLDTLPGAAFAINNSGQVVGSRISMGHNSLAMLWAGGLATDLNSFLDAATVAAGWVLTDARSINESGSIVGDASNTLTGETHAFLLSPVPEPSAYALMLLGLGAVVVRARSTRRSP